MVFFSRNNQLKIKGRMYVKKLDEYKSIGTHRIALYVNGDNVTCFDNFGAEHIPKKIEEFIGKKNITTNIYRIQTNDSVMCGYFCIAFINFMQKVKSFLSYTNLFSPNKDIKNDKIVKYFQ